MDAKDIRKQLINVIQQELPELLSKEVAQEIEKKIMAKLELRVVKMENNLRETLKMLDDRSKAIQGFLVRAATSVTKPDMQEPMSPQDAPAVKDEE